jgi:hypothetical protein
LQIREGEVFVPTSLETSLEQINQLSRFEKLESEDVDLRLDMAGGSSTLSSYQGQKTALDHHSSIQQVTSSVRNFDEMINTLVVMFR